MARVYSAILMAAVVPMTPIGTAYSQCPAGHTWVIRDIAVGGAGGSQTAPVNWLVRLGLQNVPPPGASDYTVAGGSVGDWHYPSEWSGRIVVPALVDIEFYAITTDLSTIYTVGVVVSGYDLVN